MGQESSRLRQTKSMGTLRNAPPSESLSPDSMAKTSRLTNDPNFRWMEGRKYHNVAGISYFLPCDDAEIDRLHQFNFLVKEVFGGNIMWSALKSIKEGARVLDVGCGPGTWILDLATAHPECEFVGVDISVMFPELIMPSNVHFVRKNVIEGLPFEDNHFDLVQMRMMASAFKTSEWPKVMSEIYRITKPGGYVQQVEIGGEFVTTDRHAREFDSKVTDFMAKRGQDIKMATKVKHLVEEVGFEVVQYEMRNIPLGWGGPIGDMMLEDLRASVMAAKPLLMWAFDLSKMQYDQYVNAIMHRFKRTYSHVSGCIAVGWKPEVEGETQNKEDHVD